MDKNQKAKYNMLVKLLAYLNLTANAAIYVAYAQMVALVAVLDGIKDSWDTLLSQEVAQTTGMTSDQDTAKHNMADQFELIANAVHAYALSVDNQTLVEQVKYSASQIYNLGNAQAAAICDQIIIATGPYVSLLADYGITSTYIIAADAKITAYEATLGQSQANEAIKTAANVAIDTLIHDTLEPKLIILDGLVGGPVLHSQTDFIQGYKAVRVIDNLPTIHTELTVQFYKAGTTTPIIGAQIKEMISGKAAVSDNVGIAHLIKFKGGKNLMFEASAPGFTTQQIVLTVLTSKKVSITVELS